MLADSDNMVCRTP